MLILVGPSASGKTEIANILISDYHMKKVVTYTTRPMRVNEVAGVSYNFVTMDEFLKMKENDEFVETTFYNNNYYGTRKKDVSSEKIVVLDLNGLKSFQEKMPDAIFSVYLDTAEETRILRMALRGDSREQIEKRIINDRQLFDKNKIVVDHIIRNEDTSLEKLADTIYQIYTKNIK
ncbi:MAG TPA: guanylate kinase [Bacilli bacterium]|jgi:guanylate kinase|nr:guanylate kinase [Acholeplasmataceae bacterium]HNZ77917.1 guanylate kinase [Bacilli bacterium]HOD61468.1 guanylate kinase [Bacilli bacterium]HOH61482.1 guanylate kinase [Bacilli bacterium]HPM14380.1 guanylate kinase [Bacilli bacterium]